jgi:hypothetical protein
MVNKLALHQRGNQCSGVFDLLNVSEGVFYRRTGERRGKIKNKISISLGYTSHSLLTIPRQLRERQAQFTAPVSPQIANFTLLF